jgi:hypothetical protein
MFHVPEESVSFFGDTVSLNSKGERVATRTVWAEIFRMIDGAQNYLLVDVSMWNAWQAQNPETAQALSKELADHLIAAKKAHPGIAITVLVDPVNTLYGGVKNPDIDRVVAAEIPVTFIKTTELRDANLPYSTFWRTFLRWFGNSEGGKLPHPFHEQGESVSLRSLFALFNMRGSSRVVVIADNSSKKIAVLTTALPAADRDSADMGTALRVSDHIWKSAVDVERTVGTMSDVSLPVLPLGSKADDREGDVRVSFLHEENVPNRLLRILERLHTGDKIDVSTHALADREVIEALLAAGQRGARVRLLLDPSVHWMQYAQHGIPNRAVAMELYTHGVSGLQIRYCELRTESCRQNMALGSVGGTPFLMIGSATLTRRELRNFNLTADIYAESDKGFKAHEDAEKYFEMLWDNHGGAYSTDVGLYRNDPSWQRGLYRFMERFGLSVF